MEPQHMTPGDWKAFRTLYTNPFAEVNCSQCGSRVIYKVGTRSEALGNIYYIECTGTPRCWFYPIPPTLTPECIRWQHPDEIKANRLSTVQCDKSCVVTERCAVELEKDIA